MDSDAGKRLDEPHSVGAAPKYMYANSLNTMNTIISGLVCYSSIAYT